MGTIDRPMGFGGVGARRLGRGVLLLLSAALLTACAGPSPVPSPSAGQPSSVPSQAPLEGGRLAGSLVELFQQRLRDTSLRPLEVEILERAVQAGSISADDYERSHTEFKTCLAQHGVDAAMWSWRKGADGVYQPTAYQAADEGTISAANAYCQPEVDAVQQLFQIQQSNPDLFADPALVGASCLRRQGVVAGDYSAEQFGIDVKKASDLSAPFDPYDPPVNACLAAAGYLFVKAGDDPRGINWWLLPVVAVVVLVPVIVFVRIRGRDKTV